MDLGPEFARALAAKDRIRIAELLDPEVDFRALTPRRPWEATGPGDVLTILFGSWFTDTDDIRSLDRVETDTVADRERVGYRFSITNPEGDFVLEQQAYFTERAGRIDWMRVVCSGYRPTA